MAVLGQLIDAIRDGRGRRFIDDPQHLEAGQGTGVWQKTGVTPPQSEPCAGDPARVSGHALLPLVCWRWVSWKKGGTVITALVMPCTATHGELKAKSRGLSAVVRGRYHAQLCFGALLHIGDQRGNDLRWREGHRGFREAVLLALLLDPVFQLQLNAQVLVHQRTTTDANSVKI